jgi:hypothetical protein
MMGIGFQGVAVKELVSNHLKQGNCARALEAASKIFINDATKNEALSAIVTNPGCAEREPTVSLKATSMMGIGFQGSAIQKLVSNHLKQGNCAGALEAVSKIFLPSHKCKALRLIAADSTCLNNHKDIADKASQLLDSMSWWTKVASYII